MLDKLIFFSFSLLFFLTPLFWTPLNFELFEFNKMLLVYLFTTIITGLWILKMLNQKTFIFKRTPLDIFLILFLIANILSTIFSIDKHTSIWGYYSRSNGGLLSIISYTLLYFAYVANIDHKNAIKTLKIAVFGAALVALWAIPEHFGISPSCVILRNELTAQCWVQDVQARVFATLGQPNWLAAYLSMLIFPVIYLILQEKNKLFIATYLLSLIILYSAFTFTYSRGGTLGFLAGLATFLLFTFVSVGKKQLKLNLPVKWHLLAIVALLFLLINILYGSAMIRFNLSKFLTNTPEKITTNQQTLTNSTQLESEGTETGAIRLIVWQGAIDIFKKYPLFGSGVETFAYSYYKFRPVSHNLVSEWDFLYNKAHNEYLNYLANTGTAGFVSYILIIVAYIIWSIRYYLSNIHTKKADNHSQYLLSLDKRHSSDSLLIPALLAGYVSYLVQNIFGFSVVVIALFFYLFPAIFQAISSPQEDKYIKHAKNDLFLIRWIYFRPIYTQILKIFIIIFTAYLIFFILRLWYADTSFASGVNSSEEGNPGRAYNQLSVATTLNKYEPYYKSELAFAAASAALALQDSDSSLSARLKKEASDLTDEVLQNSPNNVSFFRTAIRTYYQLSGIDDAFTKKTLEALDKTIELAPTDPKLYYNKAVVLGQIDKNEEAMSILEEAIKLKPNYKDAYFALAIFYYDQNNFPQALEYMNKILQFKPNDPEVIKQLNDWGKQGISTTSAQVTR